MPADDHRIRTGVGVAPPGVPESERLLEALRAAQSASEHRLTDEIRRAIETLSATLLSAERETAKMAIEAQKESLEILRHERDMREASVAQRERLASRVQMLQSQLLEARSALETSLAAEAAARHELEHLWGSTSWRYTRPLREIGLVLRRATRRILGAPPDAVESALDDGPGGRTAESRAELSPSSARVLDELQQAMNETRKR
jgi:small-conductance mechanosensitive channel